MGCLGPSLAYFGRGPTPPDRIGVSSIGVGAVVMGFAACRPNAVHAPHLGDAACCEPDLRLVLRLVRSECGGISESRLVRRSLGRTGRVFANFPHRARAVRDKLGEACTRPSCRENGGSGLAEMTVKQPHIWASRCTSWASPKRRSFEHPRRPTLLMVN